MLDCILDISADSVSHPITPDQLAQKFPFYLVDVGYLDCGDKHYTIRDRLNNYLLLMTVSGCGKITWKNHTSILDAGTAVLIDCNILHDYRTLPSQRWQYRFIHFKALSIEGYRSMFLDQLTPVKLRSPDYAIQLMRSLYTDSFQTGVFSYSQQSNTISGMLTELVSSLADNEAHNSQLNRKDIQELAQFIHDNYNQPLHLEDFTEQIRLSKHHLIRLFERQIGMTPYRYLHMCRINQGQILLQSTDMTISQIAYAVGYNDPVVFIRHFKSFNNMTPSVYRSQWLAYPAAKEE